jgi:hypothetical protein
MLFLEVIYTERFAAYKNAVVSAYHQKRSDAQESWLIKPTRARVRQLCCKLIEDGLENRDEKMLRDYFKMESTEHDFLAAIKKTDADDFQGFVLFLNNTEINPAETNIELLAWLIGFQLRPFSKYIKQPKNEQWLIENKDERSRPNLPVKGQAQDNVDRTQATSGLKEDDLVQEDPQQIEMEIPPIASAEKIKSGRLIAIAALLVGAFVIWWCLPSDNKCMYWDNDHYAATSCNIPRADTPLVQLDAVKLGSFRRLHHVDSLTYKSVNKLWYVRVGGIIEVYSANGKHPLYPQKKLAPLTYYAVNVCKKQHGY